MGTQSTCALRQPLSLKAGAEQAAREHGSTLNNSSSVQLLKNFRP